MGHCGGGKRVYNASQSVGNLNIAYIGLCTRVAGGFIKKLREKNQRMRRGVSCGGMPHRALVGSRMFSVNKFSRTLSYISVMNVFQLYFPRNTQELVSIYHVNALIAYGPVRRDGACFHLGIRTLTGHDYSDMAFHRATET